jgi:hypothetical protein
MGGTSDKVAPGTGGFSDRQIEAMRVTYHSLFVKGKILPSGFQACFNSERLPELPQRLEAYFIPVTQSKEPVQEFVALLGLLLHGRRGDLVQSLSKRSSEALGLAESQPGSGLALVEALLKAWGQEQPLGLPDFTQLSWAETTQVLARDLPALESALVALIRTQVEQRPLLAPLASFSEGSVGRTALPVLLMSALDLAFAPGCELLYSTEDHGFSLQKLVHSALSYEGGVVLFIKTSTGAVLGTVLGEGLKDKAEFYGTSSTYLFTFAPAFRTFRSTPSSADANFVYCNTKILKSVKYPAGLGFGGNPQDGFRLWLGLDLEQSYVSSACQTFEPGALLPMEETRKDLRIALIECWGFGGASARQHKEKADMAERIRLENMRKVDKTAFVDGDFNKGFLLSNTFRHRGQMREEI